MEEEDQPQEQPDPMKFMEMQAQYLRMLAQYYDAEGGGAAQGEDAPVRIGEEEEAGSDHGPEEPASPQIERMEEEESKEEEPAAIEDRQLPSRFVRSQSHDELPIRGLPKSFEESLEAEMLKTTKKSPPPRGDHPKPTPKKQFSSSPPTPSYKKKDQIEGNEAIDDTPKPQKTFLKRGQGQLCLKTAAGKNGTEREKGENAGFDIEKPGEEPLGDAGLSFSEDSKESTPDEESVNYREEVSRLTATLKELQREHLRLKGDKDRRDRKIKELEGLKAEINKEKQQLLKDFDEWKSSEMAKLRKERKLAEGTPRIAKAKREEIEKLRAVVKKLEEEARARDNRHKQQIAKLQMELQEGKMNRSSLPDVSGEQPSQEEMEVSKPGDSVPVSKTVAADGKIITVHSDGKKEIQFPNGVRKEVYPDDFTVIYFTNNDIKQTFPDGKIVYYFADAQTTQTTFPDGLQIFKFANGQSEKHFTDNTKEITFPDGTVKCIFPDGEEESIFPDGTVQKVDSEGIKYIDFVNGQKDTIYPDGTKVREFADGRIKKILPNGKVVES